MRRAIIMTSIYEPDNLVDWHSQLGPNDFIVVAGDLKSRHDYVRGLLAELPGDHRYLHPEDSYPWSTHRVVGFNSVQRRNLALLEALRREPDYVITLDDDNYPTPGWVDAVDRLMVPDTDDGTVDLTHVSSAGGWWNAGELCSPVVRCRGLPVDQRRWSRDLEPLTFSDPAPARVGVFASLWLGDPDIDAVDRLVLDPTVRSVADYVATLEPGTWCSFNSQATAFRAELAPLLMMWPGCGRYDDIWASYAARAVMDTTDWRVAYGAPAVRQTRNDHDVVRDMEVELLGYRHTPHLTTVMRELGALLPRDVSVTERLRRLAASLVLAAPYLPADVLRAFPAWFEDLERLGIK